MLDTSKLLIYFLLILFPLGLAKAVSATTMGVSARIEPSCSFTINPLNFGVYDGEENEQIANIAVTCTNGTEYSLGLGFGNNTLDGKYDRKMTSGKNTIDYKLYQDKDMQRIWGNDLENSISGRGTGSEQIYRIYGLIPVDQPLLVGNYSDLVTISLRLQNSDNSLLVYQSSVRLEVRATVEP